MKELFSNFSKKYPYLLGEERIEYFSLFGGLENFDFELVENIDIALKQLLNNFDISLDFPFFILDEPFKKFLIKLSISDGKIYSLFKRVGIGEELGLGIVKELIDSDIVYIVNSREKPLLNYSKQKIKKELKYYTIEPKIYFKKPFYRFWFNCVAPCLQSSNYQKCVIENYKKYGYKLISLVFEQLSLEVIKEYYKNRDELVEVGSYWDVNSEFDIYCKTKSGKMILGECKYKNRPITHSELIKLKSKALSSNLNIDKFILFSKAGYTQELYKNRDDNLLIFELDALENII